MAKEKMIIDGKNAVLGRLAAFVAKKALQGEEVVVCNCNDIIITGNPKSILAAYKVKRARGGDAQKGPYFPTTVERIVKRTIRGMIPYKKVMGNKAFKRIKCYMDTPIQYKDLEKINLGKEIKVDYITMQKLCKLL